MQLTITPTPTITTIDGVKVRVWKGSLPSGNPVQVFVVRVGTDDPGSQAELERHLQEMPAPREVALAKAVSLRHIL